MLVSRDLGAVGAHAAMRSELKQVASQDVERDEATLELKIPEFGELRLKDKLFTFKPSPSLDQSEPQIDLELTFLMRQGDERAEVLEHIEAQLTLNKRTQVYRAQVDYDSEMIKLDDEGLIVVPYIHIR